MGWRCYLKGHFTTLQNQGKMVENDFFLGGGFKNILLFTNTWGNDLICLIFFKWVETTNLFLFGFETFFLGLKTNFFTLGLSCCKLICHMSSGTVLQSTIHIYIYTHTVYGVHELLHFWNHHFPCKKIERCGVFLWY